MMRSSSFFVQKYSFKIVVLFLLTVVFIACNVNKDKKIVNKPITGLEASFIKPPDSIQTSVYWYWISDHISKEGVVKDLHAMKSVGINRAFIGNIGIDGVPYGNVKMFSEEWWDILHTALKTATELNIEIGIFNSPGWSQSGGPWVKTTEAMRYLTSSETLIKGPLKASITLPMPTANFQDVKVLAFKTPKAYQSNIADNNTIISSSLKDVKLMFDKDTATHVALINNDEVSIDFEAKNEFILRSINVLPAEFSMQGNAQVLVEVNGNYIPVAEFVIERKNINLNVGFKPFAPVSISVPATVAKKFRVILRKTTPKFGIKELVLSSSPILERYSEKSLAKMFPSPLPYWKEYQWPQQPIVTDNSLMINPNEVIDLTQFMDVNGVLKWDVPSGDWAILRMGMAPTGVTNGPASPEATGLEIDKMSKVHVASHFDAFLGEIQRRIPAEDRKTWKVVVQDSYETGGQNWTDDMLEKFQANYGYSPLPYLPTLEGKVIGSQEMSDRFLWDLRRFIADRVAYDYVGGLREVSHKNGLTTWLENYGHWGFPGEFLQYGGQSDEIGGEFWSEGELGNIENRAASSAAHIYGKTKVSAESFTAAGKTFGRYPEVMKQRGDRFFTEGINNTLLHVYIQQPDERKPGINAWFGNEFNRNNTWFSYLDLFIDYLKRCNFMLQQGKYVADVAYFIGEDAPKMTGVTDPALPKGYSFDYINAEVIKRIQKVENGRIYLADGMNYGILVLPKLETMRPELLQKLTDLVAQGATVLGPAPSRSPSLENYPKADAKVKELASALWGNINGKSVKSHRFGKGLVLSGMDMQTALNVVNIRPDVETAKKDPVLYIHRTTPD
ncbi:MAG TPA: glycosyl hydrolase, partial [Pelobium sp.]|nr:glycosyl hydrolase [Pelobium sp.]